MEYSELRLMGGGRAATFVPKVATANKNTLLTANLTDFIPLESVQLRSF